MQNISHLYCLSITLDQARLGRGFCAPNPAVGACVVKNGVVIAEGYHQGCGLPHAEVEALNKVGALAIGATLYVSLEPCCHRGRTPPCVGKIKAAGIVAVYFAYPDPNPLVAGKGQQQLQQAGIICEHISLPAINHFYQSYQYWTERKMPWVSIKLALSADDKIAGEKGARVPITGAACQDYTHQQRCLSDAILTTAETLRQDDPQLNVRLRNQIFKKPLYVLDSNLRTPLTAKIFQTTMAVTIFHSALADNHLREPFIAQGTRCVAVESNAAGLDLHQVLKQIGADGKHDVWVEAGGRCFQSFVKNNFAHRVIVYRAPTVLGETATSAFSGSLEQMLQDKYWLTDSFVLAQDQVFEWNLK